MKHVKNCVNLCYQLLSTSRLHMINKTMELIWPPVANSLCHCQIKLHDNNNLVSCNSFRIFIVKVNYFVENPFSPRSAMINQNVLNFFMVIFLAVQYCTYLATYLIK
uniref:Uncharacterized protein n=1 Tax=Cacopsylla melanoneura TaxID=428564 RepID=A0A8D9F8Z1_9HEMI